MFVAKRIRSFIVVLMVLVLFTCQNPFVTLANPTSTANLSFDFHNHAFHGQKTGFNHWVNTYMVSTHTPHHNGYDMIFSKNDLQYIDAKFQYGDFRKDLEDEWISIYTWTFSDPQPAWKYLGRALTDSDGRIHYVLPKNLNVGVHLVKLFVEGDGTEANMYIQVLDKTSKYVVFDIDGTLTTDDFENIKAYASELWNGSYQPKAYNHAVDVVRFYAEQGYDILYLSARPYWLSEKTQTWLVQKGFPRGMIHTYEGSEILSGSGAITYKLNYLKSIISKGVQIDYAYGNAESDISAYYGAGLTGDRIFIIGENAGLQNTTPIRTYGEHLLKLKQ
ncbi:LNS2 domain-containing protein [Paenibacillus turpanensis]|uniref:LNS2 domain-containing protein n=1 Tax=Paenibacillus turpanensis TaxID=2689078 RepID=UPI00140BDCE0|nr:HAD family acid phosphatase [Paenibacillus turpanensis]